MTTGELVVELHDPTGPVPSGWEDWLAKSRQPAVWDWSIVGAVALDRPGVMAATVRDGDRVRGLLTGRFVGPRGRGGRPLGGLLDLDSLVSSAVPGVVLDEDEPDLLAATMAALRAALRKRYGARVAAVLARQVAAEDLPAVSSGASLIREGGPIAVFHNEYDDFDGYLADLSRSRRGSLRRVLRAFDADDQIDFAFTATGQQPGRLTVVDMQRLHEEVIDRNHTNRWLRRRLLNPALAGAQLTHPGVERLTYHRPSGELVAYSLVWNHDQAPILGGWGMVGLDRGGPRNAWFHQAALTLRWAVESGRSMVLSGQGSLKDKVDLGYRLHRQWAVLTPVGRSVVRHRRVPGSTPRSGPSHPG